MTPEERSFFKQALLDEFTKEGVNTVEEIADKILEEVRKQRATRPNSGSVDLDAARIFIPIF